MKATENYTREWRRDAVVVQFDKSDSYQGIALAMPPERMPS
jgi:hypothetical protein